MADPGRRGDWCGANGAGGSVAPCLHPSRGGGEQKGPRRGAGLLDGAERETRYRTTTVLLIAVVEVPPRLWITVSVYVPAGSPVMVAW